ncbi:16S rRNA (cytosine(967)-C(5))-methyltransferase RsmB [Alkalibacillus haloalkaliphilus]|uniref:16S rRNA (cytosine(967)-C(5))-methyltransferase RsmB n=1 Tax=Alkalibacillus haloalkaliphilus TaxID=94136 RepID=UPI0002F3E8B3|nr:16S rRNA (cytosine(967)-C(5))-methyltransferase RsmB [Alkalibacillus haloalkaliphilus]
MAKQQTVREVALNLLQRVSQSGGFSHILINQAISKHEVKQEDKGLFTEIVYGTLQRQLTLDFYLTPFVGNKKMDHWVRTLLRMSVYQMVYLERVPDHAVINEAVTIAKKKGHKGISGFVNGVLRNIQRKGVPSFDTIEDKVERVSIETSHPYWLVSRWVDQYGFDVTKKMCESNMESKKVSVRIQPEKLSIEEAIEKLEVEGIKVERSTLSNQGLNIIEGNILRSELFPHSLTIQDETSMLVSEMIGAKPNMTVLDACSAPGGKATHIAEKMNSQGEIYAYDLHQSKVNLVKEKARDLDLTNIQVKAYDSRQLYEVHDDGTFDRILLDAPCTGLGVLRSKPDIKYSKQEENIEQLANIQHDLLRSVLPLLKENGKLVYSTCTVDRHENEEQIKQLLKDFSNLQVDPAFFEELPESCQHLEGKSEYGIQIFPQDFKADGFFITRLVFK